MKNQILINIVGNALVLTGILDALKYYLQANRIKKAQSSKNISRRFINYALLNDIVKLVYGICIIDFYITFTSILALVTMGYMFWEIYWWYPYTKRGLKNFKRPNIFKYFINSCQPNQTRKRL